MDVGRPEKVWEVEPLPESEPNEVPIAPVPEPEPVEVPVGGCGRVAATGETTGGPGLANASIAALKSASVPSLR
jgi:hypothetical protein